jgi:hypothetical protein
MPYIQFFDRDTKKELFVMSSNPMILQNTIHHMKELYDNYDKVYSAITDQDMKNLLEYSNNSKKDFPIDFEFLTTNNMMKWPGWWALDREK